MKLQRIFCVGMILLYAPLSAAATGNSPKLSLPAGASATVAKIYSFDLDGAIEDARHLQEEQPDHPLGYLLEAEARWWRIWCLTADFKYGMAEARRRPQLPAHPRHLELAPQTSTPAG